jgi:ribosomal-protein-alanine N-acetyltransferase
MATILRATPEHFLRIAELDRQAWLDNRNPEFIPDGEHVWRIWVEHALVFVAVEADRVIGAVLAFPCLSGDYCLHKVFVHPSQRGKGLGSLLFEKLLGEVDSRGAGCFLTVDPINDAAIRLYAKWGFSDRQFVKGFYRANEDRLVLRRAAVANR